jgi:hypothetical protein
MPTRQEAYEAIDSERDYQDSLREDRVAGTHNARFTEVVLPLPGELTCIRTYLRKAEDSYTNNPGEAPQETMEIIRKIAGMCVRTMEHHGVYNRS